MLSYSIITAAKDEEKYITFTLDSVVCQTLLPVEWLIIDDDSNDRTSEIVLSYCQKYTWIKLISLKAFRPELKTTGGRVSHLLNIALKKLSIKTDLIGRIDADVQFPSNFIENLISQFDRNYELGIASGHLVFNGIRENVNYNKPFTRGAVMLLRYEIINKVGGFFESKGRGEDRLLSVAARYFHWQTFTYPIFFNHLKPEGRRHSYFHESFNTGYYKGSIPYRLEYFLITQIKHMFKKPLFLGSALQIIGYIFSRYIKRYRPFPDYVKYQLRKEQNILAI